MAMLSQIAFASLLCCANLIAQTAHGVIAGSVRDAVTGQPIPGVQVYVRGGTPRLASPLTGILLKDQAGGGATGAQGDFRLEQLQPGDYDLYLAKTGFAVSVKHIRVGSGPSEEIRLSLAPNPTLEGRIFDALDEPLAGIYVTAEGVGRATPPGSAVSGADGRYRIRLMPGDYRIVFRTPYAMRRKSLERNPDTGDLRGYPNSQYYPGVPDALTAGVIPLATGAHLDGFDIHLRRIPLVELSGYLIDSSTREPLAGGEVELVPEYGGMPDETFRRRRLEGGSGAFRFELITPGNYSLLVYRDPTKLASQYVRQVYVGSAGVAGLQVSVPQFGSVSGKMIVPKKAKDRNPFTVSLLDLEATIGEDGSFRLDDIPPGSYAMQVRWKDIFRTDDLFVESIRQDGTPIGLKELGAMVSIAEGTNTRLEIELSDQTGRVTGNVTDDDQRPAEGALVVLSTEGRMLYRVPTNRGGEFTTRLPPGAYSVTAWPSPTTISDLPADRSRACGDRIASLKVTANESAFTQLRICKP